MKEAGKVIEKYTKILKAKKEIWKDTDQEEKMRRNTEK